MATESAAAESIKTGLATIAQAMPESLESAAAESIRTGLAQIAEAVRDIGRGRERTWRGLLFDVIASAVPMAIGMYGISKLWEKMDPNKQDKDQELDENSKKIIARLQANGRGGSVTRISKYEQIILNDVALPGDIAVTFNDIGGLNEVKQSIHETVIMPLRNPELFESVGQSGPNALLRAPRGVLFYGPPGTGKTMMAKAIARGCGATFINVKLSSIQSKWFGESVKIVNAIFSLATKLAPSIIFLDEIDLFLSQRGDSSGSEATATMKAEFMSLWDGLDTGNSGQITVLGATNRPFDIDEAVQRRLPRTFLFDLPGKVERTAILRVMLRGQNLAPDVNLRRLAAATPDYSGSDLQELCKYAMMLPIREVIRAAKRGDPNAPVGKPRASSWADFELALKNVQATGRASHEYQKGYTPAQGKGGRGPNTPQPGNIANLMNLFAAWQREAMGDGAQSPSPQPSAADDID